MLSRLLVRNYVLIDSLEIDFPEGLIIITGQTGAGKSILLGALSLLMGAKADARIVSEGAENCVVEAEFEADPSDEELKDLLEENDVEWDGGHLIVRRVVNRSGRSRSFVNDSPIPVGVLQELSSRLVDIHSQHQTLLLSDARFQLDTLDHFAGNSVLRQECANLWKQLQQQNRSLSELEQKLARISADKDYNEAQYRQLESASLRDGELAQLEDEQKQLANAEEIKTGLSAAEELYSPSSEGVSIDWSLKEADRLLAKVARYVPEASELSDRVASCRRELDDIFSEVSSLNSRVDISPERLEQVEDRMSLLYSLMQKHSCSNESELIAVRDRLSEELYDSTAVEEKIAALKTDISKILAISGQSGLYLYVSQARNGAIVEALADKKRTSVGMTNKLTSLADISIYTDDEEVKLQQDFLNMKEVLGENDAPSAKSKPEELKALFEKALPTYDRDRFYVSHMKKVVEWYNTLKNYASLDFVNPEEEVAEQE